MKKLLSILLILPFTVFSQINDTWDAVKVGTTDMQKIYVGNTLVWQKQQNINLLDGIYLCWEADAVVLGLTPDATFNGNNGTLVGNYSVVTGKMGNAIYLEDVNASIDAPANTNNLSEYTVSIWVNLDANIASRNIWAISGFQEGLEVYEPISNTSYNNLFSTYYISSSNTRDWGSTGQFLDDTWTHIVVTRNTSGMVVYVNGSAIGSITGGTWNSLANTLFAVGSYWGDGVSGYFDQIAVWLRALNSSEVAYLNNNMNGRLYVNW